MSRWLVAAAVLLGGAAACGDGGGSALERADEHLAGLTSGELDLAVTAEGGGSGPVGFRVTGPFSWAGDHELAVVDLTHVQVAGDEEVEQRVVSDGEAAVVVVDGEVVEVPASELAALRVGDGSGGIGDLGVAGWVVGAEESEGEDGATVVRGEVDVADMLSDLARVAAQVAGEPDLPAPDGDAADRLRDLVESSEIEVVLDGDDLRSLRATVDFAAPGDVELRRALGRYAAARLIVELSLAELDDPLEVDLPTR